MQKKILLIILIERHVMVGMSVGQSDHFNRGTVHLMIESLLSSPDSSTGHVIDITKNARQVPHHKHM